MRLRSLLFVPGDRPERFPKGAASGADALILDLEDSVTESRKSFARDAVAEWLSTARDCPTFVRINPLASGLAEADLGAVLGASPDGLVLPKAEGAGSVQRLLELVGGHAPPILPLATETPSAMFELGSFRTVTEHLAAISWGAEDLPAALGALTARESDGRYTPPYELARSLTLFAAHASGVPAIDTVFPQIDALDDLSAYAARARRDGFTGMLAIHPKQVEIINAGFTPSDEEIRSARELIAAFDSQPDAGVMEIGGRMVDRPHLLQAQRILAQAGESSSR